MSKTTSSATTCERPERKGASLILVTGAAGKTGRAVVGALSQRGAPVRAFVHRREQTSIARTAGATEITHGDLHRASDLEAATEGVEAVYLIVPNVRPDEVPIGAAAIAAARRAGVRRFVYHSVLLPQIQAMPHHWRKLLVEEKLVGSGLPFTILQPAAYMQNLRSGWDRIVSEGVYAVPYALSARVALVDLADVAEVAATVLCEVGHEGAIYPLCSGEEPDQREVAASLAAVLERPIESRVVPRREWAAAAAEAGLDADARATLCSMFRYYEECGLRGNANTLRGLLGRSPTSLRSYLERAWSG